MDARQFSDDLLNQAVAEWPNYQPFLNELSRRAEIRLERGEYGATHDAAWYAPRCLHTDAHVVTYDARPTRWCDDCHRAVPEIN